ncbi:MAG: PQQ-like beta-propeller repeat protein [Thermoplasmata archaeon]|nr:MAG: PQQ-like beta-propeller repeat protein [Thermoplasmata archaeon]
MKVRCLQLLVHLVVWLLILNGLIFLDAPQSKIYDYPEDNMEKEPSSIHNSGLGRSTRAGNDWPMYRGDLFHSGFGTSSIPSNDTPLWSNTTGSGDGYGSPAVADGRVFAGSADGYLYCFDLYTGERLWRTFLSSGDFGVCGSPAVANDHVVVFCSGDDTVYRLRVSDGSEDWSYSPGSGAYGGSSPAISNGRIYVGSGNRYLYCLDEISGNMIWSYRTDVGPWRNYGIQSSPAVANGRVFVGACDTYLYCFNESQPSAPNAEYFWRTDLYDAVFASPAVANGRVFCGSGYYAYGEGDNSHTMFCLDELTGEVIWSYVTGSDILSSPAIAYGNCYFTSTDGELYCVDAEDSGPTPSFVWSETVGDSWSSPAVADGKVVVGSRGTNSIYCFDALSGALIWSRNLGNDIYSSPAISDGKVVVGVRGSPESVYCFGNLTSPPSPPAPPTNLQAQLVGNGNDVMVFWDASIDDGSGDDNVLGYTVYKSSAGVNGPYDFEAWVLATDSPTYDWTDVGAGDGDLNDYFYIVRANNTDNNEENNVRKVGKVVNQQAKGWNLISVPLIQASTSRNYSLQTIEGNSSAVQSYHAGKSKPWLHWNDKKPAHLNDVNDITNENGYYIYMVNTDYLVTAGKVPTTTSISLYHGWNMVGYPSLEIRTRNDALSSISASYNRVIFLDTQSGREVFLGPSDLMSPGYGYWIHVTENCELVL